MKRTRTAVPQVVPVQFPKRRLVREYGNLNSRCRKSSGDHSVETIAE